MFQFLRSLFGRRTPTLNTDRNPAYRFSSGDAVYIEQALNILPTIGLHPTLPPENFGKKSEDIARELEGVSCSRQPTLGHWILFALSGEKDRAFSNAMCLGDHCYDGMSASDLADMIRDIVGMAASEWHVEDVKIIDPSHAFELGSSSDIQIVASPPVTSFTLQLAKDFDWTLIYHLNERLPSSIKKKFAILLDGNATIVYLEKYQIENLNEYCWDAFFFDEGSS